MVVNQDIEQLTLDALFERRQLIRGSFVNNLAGEELRECPPSALPAIEKVIRETVESAIAMDESIHGLNYVLGAYLIVCAKTDPGRAVQFFSEASISLQVEVLVAMRIFFNVNRNGYISGVAPPGPFRDFVERLVLSRDESVRSAAMRTLERVKWIS